eukprot:jgi/Phyca11/564464/estExt2_Genewise1.C_PHYCAscaffold_150053
MRAATREIHNISDNLVNLKLVVALTDKQLYGRALMLFYYVYAQLESAIEKQKDHEAFKGLYESLPEIARADGIKKDLRFYLGEDWSTKFQATQAVQSYVKCANHFCCNCRTRAEMNAVISHLYHSQDPVLILPYCYHMYMAMLAGGMMIKKLVKRSFAPPEGEGLNCFAFDVKSNKVVRSLDGAGNHVVKFLLKWFIIIGFILAVRSQFL